MTISKILAVSTSHLPEHLGSTGLDDHRWVTADSIDGGWFIYVPGNPADYDPENNHVPAEVTTLFRYAVEQGCRFIHLHCTNQIDPALPRWSW